MMNKRLTLLCSIFAMSALLVGCDSGGDECDDPDVVCECAGDIDVTVPLSTVPEKLRIVWTTTNGELVIDECEELTSGSLLVERQAGAIVINDGGFGYRPPATFSLVVSDLKDCVADPEILVDVEDHAVPGAPHELCTHAEVTVTPGA
jgi:hypothetical protein